MLKVRLFNLTIINEKVGIFYVRQVMKQENDANLNIFSELVPNNLKIEDFISIDSNILTEDNTLII